MCLQTPVSCCTPLHHLEAGISQTSTALPLCTDAQHAARLSSCPTTGQDLAILQLSGELVNRACKATPGEAKYAVEGGYLALLQGDPKAALALFSQASHLHELDMDAMYGSIECDLLTGKVSVHLLPHSLSNVCVPSSCCFGPPCLSHHVWQHQV